MTPYNILLSYGLAPQCFIVDNYSNWANEGSETHAMFVCLKRNIAEKGVASLKLQHINTTL